MSLVALLALSHPAASAKIGDLHSQQPRRRLPFRRRNSLAKVYGPNSKSRYRSLLAGFSVDGLLALDAASATTGSRSSSTKGAAMSLPVLRSAKNGLHVSPQTALSAIVGSLDLWPTAAWRRKSKKSQQATSSSSNSSHGQISVGPGRPPLPTTATRRQSQSHGTRDDPKASPRVQIQPRRSSKSNPRPSPLASSRLKQGHLWRRVAHAANAQISSKLMAQKFDEESSNNNNNANREDDEISYVIDEDELASRFYIETFKAAESRETLVNQSRASLSAPRSSDREQQQEEARQTLDAREREWRTKQLALERQVAALLAENQTKTSLINYLLDENTRLVGDCECRVSTVIVPTETRASGNNQDDICASTGRAQKRACEHPEEDGDDDGFMPETTSREVKMSRRKSAVTRAQGVHAAERKLHCKDSESLTRGAHEEQQHLQRRISFVSVAVNEAEFEGIVREIEAELFAFVNY